MNIPIKIASLLKNELFSSKQHNLIRRWNGIDGTLVLTIAFFAIGEWQNKIQLY